MSTLDQCINVLASSCWISVDRKPHVSRLLRRGRLASTLYLTLLFLAQRNNALQYCIALNAIVITPQRDSY